MENILKIFCDGGSRGNPGPAASAFVVEKEGNVVFKGSKYLGHKTNNVAEYNAVILALRWLNENKTKLSIDKIIFVLDSELVVNQLNGRYKVKNENLRELFFNIKNLIDILKIKINFVSVPRERNKLADFLVNKQLNEK